MPRRRRDSLAVAVAASAFAVVGCQNNPPSTASCAITQQSTLTASPLTLLKDVRLDLTGDAYLLIGNDGDNMVRWAKVDPTSGQLGPEAAQTIPSHRPGLWYAAAGVQTATDTILVAFAQTAANGADLEIDVMPVAADGSGSTPPGPPVAVFPGAGAATSAPDLVLGSSRPGMAAGIGWVDSTTGAVMFAALGGDGQPVAPAAAIDTPSQALCLGFVPGQDDLTLGYYQIPTAGAAPQWMTAEAHEDGSTGGSLVVPLATTLSVCPKVAATSGGYVYAWQDASASWLGVYDTRTNRIFDYPFVDAFYFGGANLQPPIVGLGPVGSDYAVIFAGAVSAELWRIDAAGVRHPGALELPSLSGNLGTISAQPSAGSLYATYADYSDATAASGQRFFLKTTCF